MSTDRWSRTRTRLVLTGAVVLGASACGSPVTLAATSPGPAAAVPSAPVPTSTTPAGPPTAVRTGPGTMDHYSAEAQPAAGSCHYRTEGGSVLPDPSCTPGAVNPQVTQATIAATICRPGWTAAVRPPVSVTGAEKVGSARAYGYAGSFVTGEYDHLIPLELGGDPNDPANLWLQPNDDPNATSTHNAKDDLEYRLKRLVCSGTLTLATAQQAIAADWVAAADRYPG